MSAFQGNPTSIESSNEQEATEQNSAASPEQEQVERSDEQVVENPETDEASGDGAETPEFDRAAVEARYGLPAGALNDFEDEDSALAAIRQGIDQSLMQSLYQQPEQPEQPAPETPNTQQTDTQQKGQEIAAGSLEALQKKVAELEGTIQKQNQLQQQQAAKEVTEQASKVIDAWDSPRYGTSKSRDFRQTKNLRSMLTELREHTELLRRSGKPVPSVNVMLERMRLWDDPDFQPGSKQKQTKSVPVGTPGGHKEPDGKDKPDNIHSAIMAQWRKAG